MIRDFSNYQVKMVYKEDAEKRIGVYQISIIWDNIESTRKSFYIGRSKQSIERRWAMHSGSFIINTKRWAIDELLKEEHVSFEFDIISDNPDLEYDFINKNKPITQYEENKKGKLDNTLCQEKIHTNILQWLEDVKK